MGSCYNSIVIEASIDKVWDTIKDFHDMSWAEGVINTLEKGEALEGHQRGAKRILNGVFHETLATLDPDNFEFTYSIDDGPGPLEKGTLSNYIGRVKLHPVTDEGNTFVVWTSSWKSKNDEAIGDFCNPIYVALLDAMKKNT